MSAVEQIEIISEDARASSILNPLRRKILSELTEPDSATGVAKRLGLPRQKVNYHIRQLEKDKLVVSAGERMKRNCTERLVKAVAKTYLIGPSALGDLAAEPEKVQDRASSAYLVAISARTIQEVSALRERATEEGKQVPTLTLQADVRFSSPQDQHDFAQELSEAFARVVAKYHDAESPEGRTFRFIAGAHPVP